MHRLTLLTICALLWAAPAQGQWPTTVRDNLVIANQPDVTEEYSSAFPLAAGRVLVILGKSDLDTGVCYQIIDPEGTLQFSLPTPVCPARPILGAPKAVPDGLGGVLVAFESYAQIGHWAQRFDSLGNLLWGDSGVVVTETNNGHFKMSGDGQGGMYFGFSTGSPLQRLYLQRLDADGQRLWPGPNGIPVSTTAGHQTSPLVTSDGQGGCYIAWQDNTPPWSPNYDLRCQHFTSQGQPLWDPQGVYVAGYSLSAEVLTEGGDLIVHNPGTPGYAYRLSPQGQLRWAAPFVSYETGGSTDEATMVLGEPGYLYTVFYDSQNIYAQRISPQGEVLYPHHYGSLRVGAPLEWTGLAGGTSVGAAYRYPYLFAFFYTQQHATGTDPPRLAVQRIDSTGRAQWGPMGAILTGWNDPPPSIQVPSNLKLVPDDQGGVTAVWSKREPLSGSSDVLAKHMRADGSLGGFINDASASEPGADAGFIASQTVSLSVSPNPCNPSTTIRFDLPQAGYVRLEVFDTAGRRVGNVGFAAKSGPFGGEPDLQWYPAGSHAVTFDGAGLPSGVYLVRLEAGGASQVQKVVLLK